MNLALFLHIYQPPTQFPEVTKEIVETSYLKIIDILRKNPHAKITLNICASLTEQLGKLKTHPPAGGSNPKTLLEDIKRLVREGQIELTGSAAYHPLLPKLPDAEIVRQTKLNDQINRSIFGDVWKPSGFFPPEMAYERRVGEMVEKLGYQWLLLDESAFPRKAGFRYNDRLYKLKGTSLKVFFREREASLGIAFSKITTVSEFRKVFLDKVAPQSFIILAMDGETFGHHQIYQLTFLDEFFSSFKFELVTISELLTKFDRVQEIEPLASTWGATLEDTELGRIFPRWDNPENPIHQLQWELFNLVIEIIGVETGHAPSLRDRALHSDQFFWAAHDPCWHPQMMERGARMLKKVVLSAEGVSSKDKQRAEMLYNKIVETGRKMYGDEIVSC